MSEWFCINVVEAALLAAGKSLQLADLAQVFAPDQKPTDAELSAVLEALRSEYATRALELAHTASGWRIQVRSEYAAEVARLWPERPARYSRALLETLALIAYRQPITRGEIELVRGVAVNPNIIKTLLERNWIRVIGTRDVPGRPEVLGTTHEFLDYFGLRKLDQLPPLAELKALTELNVQLELGPAGAVEVATVGGSDSDCEPEPDLDTDAETEAEAEDMVAEGDPLDEDLQSKGQVAAADRSSDP
jgi:segregation and condensation protein B